MAKIGLSLKPNIMPNKAFPNDTVSPFMTYYTIACESDIFGKKLHHGIASSQNLLHNINIKKITDITSIPLKLVSCPSLSKPQFVMYNIIQCLKNLRLKNRQLSLSLFLSYTWPEMVWMVLWSLKPPQLLWIPGSPGSVAGLDSSLEPPARFMAETGLGADEGVDGMHAREGGDRSAVARSLHEDPSRLVGGGRGDPDSWGNSTAQQLVLQRTQECYWWRQSCVA